MPSCGSRDTKKAAQWQRIIRRQRESGQSIAEFCRQERISLGSFHWWKRRFQQGGDRPPAAGFVELVADGDPPAPSGVELRLGGGVEIHLSRGFDPETLRAALQVVVAPESR